MALEGMNFDNHLTRMLGRPSTFYGEQKTWRDWKFIFKAHIEAISPELGDEMQAEETQVHLAM